jgi:hypothetical protein
VLTKENSDVGMKVIISSIDKGQLDEPLKGIIRNSKVFEVNLKRVGIEFFKECLF